MGAGGYQMHVGPSLLSADQKYPDPLRQEQRHPAGDGYASLPPNANLSLVTGIPMEIPAGPGSHAYYTSLLMLRPPSGSPRTDPSTSSLTPHYETVNAFPSQPLHPVPPPPPRQQHEVIWHLQQPSLAASKPQVVLRAFCYTYLLNLIICVINI